MSEKNRPKSHYRAEVRRQRRQRQKVIRYSVFGIIGLAIIALIYIVFVQPRLNQNASAANATPTIMQFSTRPPQTVDTNKQYFATVKMAKGGEFVIQLYPDKAPVTVNSFIFLAEKGFYNGTTFHRVLKDFMAQGGDPTGTGTGGPGYNLPDEFNNGLTFDKAGVVAMANTGAPNSGGSQFFITFGPQSYLNGGYTIFGQVISGMDVVNNITLRDPQQNPTFPGDAIQTITISEK